jgi:hypothetical protein
MEAIQNRYPELVAQGQLLHALLTVRDKDRTPQPRR